MRKTIVKDPNFLEKVNFDLYDTGGKEKVPRKEFFLGLGQAI